MQTYGISETAFSVSLQTAFECEQVLLLGIGSQFSGQDAVFHLADKPDAMAST